MARIRPIQNWMPILHELLGQNERAAAIIGGAFIENNLALAIMSRLRPLNGAQEDDLFGSEQAPFSTLHGKIHIAFSLYLYSKTARDDLLILKTIRNRFAHRLDIRSFNEEPIAHMCLDLKFPAWYAKCIMKKEEEEPKARFMETSHHFIDGLSLTAHNIQRPLESTTITY